MAVRHRRLLPALAAIAAAGLLAGVTPALAPTLTPAVADPAPPRLRSAVLALQLRQALHDVHLERVLDTDPVTAPQPALVDKRGGRPATVRAVATARPITQQPQVDATVLELDRGGRPVAAANVLMSPQYPRGVIVPLSRDLGGDAVRYREWDDDGWYLNHGRGTVDIVPGRERAPLDFMSPYPASVLKLMVAVGVLRLVDEGGIGLDDRYDYRPATERSLCGPASSDTVRGYLDRAITESSNAAACAMIKLLWDHDAIDPLNATFRALGLPTLRLVGTDPRNGGNWTNALSMSSLDTAKLLALIGGAPRGSWRTPVGPVASPLSEPGRRFLLAMLGQQGWNDQLTTSNWCGRTYPAAGIPSRVASRWLAADGSVTVEGKSFGRDVRPCNARAQVSFAHKTGWVLNSANDVGIVRALPGHGDRHYVVSVFTNLGTKYVDAERPGTTPGAEPTVDFTQRLARLGHRIDDIERAAP